MRPGPQRLIVASYNIHGCVGSDGRLDPPRTAAVLRELDADVIGLQEVGGHAGAEGNVDQLELLARELGLTAVAGPNLVRETGPYGNALLTRRPVLGFRRIDLSHHGREPRGAIDADLELGPGRLRVIVTHLGLRWRERWLQRRLIGANLARDAGAVVLLGDLNRWWPLAAKTDPLWPGLSGARPPRTYPARLPLLPLDRILARPAAALGQVEVIKSELARVASDHLPIKAALDLSAASCTAIVP